MITVKATQSIHAKMMSQSSAPACLTITKRDIHRRVTNISDRTVKMMAVTKDWVPRSSPMSKESLLGLWCCLPTDLPLDRSLFQRGRRRDIHRRTPYLSTTRKIIATRASLRAVGRIVRSLRVMISEPSARPGYQHICDREDCL